MDNHVELKPMLEEENKFFQQGRSEGAPYLFYKYEELCDLMGHKIIYYPNGVLLALRNEFRDFETSKSFVFINNQAETIIDIHNRNSVRDPKTKDRTLFPPKFDIEIKVCEDYIYVKETDFETKSETEYVVDILTKQKNYINTKNDQLGMNI